VFNQLDTHNRKCVCVCVYLCLAYSKIKKDMREASIKFEIRHFFSLFFGYSSFLLFGFD
jgi:hypothetical protein